MNKTRKNLNKFGFTVAELVVVITILTVLSTISFISYHEYTKSARDTRRISDMENIKKSLELFYANTGSYPIPDNSGIATFSGELVWTQGVIGDGVFRNLSNTLDNKPLDPLLSIEYVYSVDNYRREYQVMYLSESSILTSYLLNDTYALDSYTPKIDGNYNEIFVNTPHYLVPIPSIITSEELPLALNQGSVKSMIVNNGSNFPNFNFPNVLSVTGSLDIDLLYRGKVDLNSNDNDKISAIEQIQTVYSGTILDDRDIYKAILNAQNDGEKLALANCLFGGTCENNGIDGVDIIVDEGGGGDEEGTGTVDLITSDNPIEIILSGVDGTIYNCDLCE